SEADIKLLPVQYGVPRSSHVQAVAVLGGRGRSPRDSHALRVGRQTTGIYQHQCRSQSGPKHCPVPLTHLRASQAAMDQAQHRQSVTAIRHLKYAESCAERKRGTVKCECRLCDSYVTGFAICDLVVYSTGLGRLRFWAIAVQLTKRTIVLVRWKKKCAGYC